MARRLVVGKDKAARWRRRPDWFALGASAIALASVVWVVARILGML
jgi:hypothetical protein